MTSIMANSGSNLFDKLCDTFGNFMTLEQIAEFALTSKVILSYKIDFLNSFHDQLVQGLWKKSSNGYIYPLDNRYGKILYVEINEDYEADVEKSLEKLRNFSTAHKVFDEMSEPTQDDSGELQVGSSKKVEYGAYKVLDELSLSALTTGDNDGLDSTCCVRDNPPDVMDCAREMFDGIPFSDYLFKIAQTTPAAPTVVQSVPVSDRVATKPNVEGIGDNFQSEYRRQMFAKLASLDDSLFQDFIVLGATTERFSMLIRVLLQDCHVSDGIPRDTYRECDSNYQVKTEFFVAFPETHPHNFVENVVWPLSVMDMSCFTSLSLPMFFSVEVHNLRAFELENDWMAFLNFKELHSWGTYPSCLSSLLLTISLENYIGRKLFGKLRGVPDKCSLNTRIFDPGGRRWSVINVAGLRKSEMLGFVFDRGRHMECGHMWLVTMV